VTVANRFLTDYRRSFTWWSVAMVATVAVTVALWPSIRGQDQFDELIRDLPDALKIVFGSQDIPFTSPPGYLHSRLFSTVLPVMLLVFGVGVGAGAVGGAEESGTIEVVLAHPVTRARFLTERYVATVVLVVALAGVAVVSLLVLAPTVGLLDGVSIGRLIGASSAATALALLHATLAFVVGCLTGRRGLAVAVAGTVAVGSYVLQGLIAATDAVDAVRFVTPWNWYLGRNLLVAAPGAQGIVLPLGLSVVLILVGRSVFLRRDLRLP
jgi:ABC-2 type transport system permease protein